MAESDQGGDLSGAELEQTEEVTEATWWQVALVGILVLAVAGALVYGLVSIYPRDLPPTKNPDFVDNIFDEQIVVFAARLVLFSLAAVAFVASTYVISSIVVRMKNEQWLRKAGPFESELAEAGETLEEEVTTPLLESLNEAWEQVDDLATRLQERDLELQKLALERDVLAEELQKLADAP